MAKKWGEKLEVIGKKLKQVEDMVRLFQPFTHDHHQIFVGKALAANEIEEKEFEFKPESIDWRKYWLGIHMPGLQRWCFPQIEGGKKEIFQPVAPVKIATTKTRSTVPSAPAPAGRKRQPEATA